MLAAVCLPAAAMSGRRIEAANKKAPLDLQFVTFEAPTTARPGYCVIRVARTSAGYPGAD